MIILLFWRIQRMNLIELFLYISPTSLNFAFSATLEPPRHPLLLPRQVMHHSSIYHISFSFSSLVVVVVVFFLLFFIYFSLDMYVVFDKMLHWDLMPSISIVPFFSFFSFFLFTGLYVLWVWICKLLLETTAKINIGVRLIILWPYYAGKCPLFEQFNTKFGLMYKSFVGFKSW